jgi:hypothetical protein
MSARPVEHLFHYTSEAGLCGILQSECLWATHFQDLSDGTEFIAAKPAILSFCETALTRHLAVRKVNGEITIPGGERIRILAQEESQRVVGILFEVFSKWDAFVFSTFRCSPGNEMFQTGNRLHWNKFGQDEGYAIQFDPAKLDILLAAERKAFSGASYFCEPAHYARQGDVPPALKSDYDQIRVTTLDIADHEISDGRKPSPNLDRFSRAFIHAISCTKDISFEEEGEARIVALQEKIPAIRGFEYAQVHTRGKNANAVRYIKLFSEKLFRECQPIERIIIGPHFERERRRRELEQVLRRKNLFEEIEITESETR